MAERTENEERPELEQLRVLHQALQQEDPVQQELAHYQRHAYVSPKKNTQYYEWICSSSSKLQKKYLKNYNRILKYID